MKKKSVILAAVLAGMQMAIVPGYTPAVVTTHANSTAVDNPRRNTPDRDSQEDREEEEKNLVDDWQYPPVAKPMQTGSGNSSGVTIKNKLNLRQTPNLKPGRLNLKQTRQKMGQVKLSNSQLSTVGSINLSAHSHAIGTITTTSMISPQSLNLGLAVGGAKDTDNFYQNLENDFLPKYHSITCEGTFYNYFFDTGIGSTPCHELFCPSFARAVNRDLYSAEPAYYLSVGLNSGLDEKSFSRKKLNLVVVLDISGSMGSPFDRYSYDRIGAIEQDKEDSTRSKMELANRTLVAMMDHLAPEDRFGVVLFDDHAYLAKPLRPVGMTDMKAIAGHIMAITDRGSTNWSAGYEAGVRQFASLRDRLKAPAEYENRIIFITDAMPNTGELNRASLPAMIKKAAADNIHTSVIGIGVDFNTDLAEYITKVRGANYFSVHGAKEFRKRLADEFDFMVTPLVFDLVLNLKSTAFAIEGVYGSPEADQATGRVMRINTLFASAADDTGVKGGVVLIKLRRTGNAIGAIELDLAFSDRQGQKHTVKARADFAEISGPDYYENSGIRKAVLLSEYVSLVKNWLLDTRRGCNDTVDRELARPVTVRPLFNPEKRPELSRIATWERTSCSLQVSEGYRKFFTLFAGHFKKEMASIHDPDLERELTVLEKLARHKAAAPDADGKPVDDWKIPSGR